MKKITLLLAFATTGFITNAQPFFGQYTFDSVKTTSGIIDPSFVPTATSVTFGSFSATGTPANPLATARFDFDDWATGSVGGMADTLFSGMTGAVSTSEYYEVTVSPITGYTLNLDSVKFTFERSATGIRTYSVRSSVDGFTANLPANYLFLTTLTTHVFVQPGDIFFLKTDITAPQNRSKITLGGASFSTLSTPVTFRFYAWNAEGASGTFSIDNVRIFGSAALAIGVKEESTAQISVSPNPSVNGMFNLDLGNTISKATVSVYNVIGKLLLTKEITSSGKQNIDLSNESNGVYFVNVKTASSTITKKIIITK